MKILMTCDPEIPVPPLNYGGVERLVSGLCQAYSALGHEVYLLANPESKEASVKKIYKWKALHSRGIKNILPNAFLLRKVVREVKPDVIHSFSRLLYLYPMFLSGMRVPVFQTYGRALSERSTNMAKRVCGKSLNFCCCGGHMLKRITNHDRWNVVYNFTDVHLFSTKGDENRRYLAFLGRIEDIKGTYEAIQVAIRTNTPLVIAGNIEAEHQSYFDEKVKPYLENPLISYIGPVNDVQKQDLLLHAKALLFPIKWEEPFGIVMIESMACGAPVVAYRRGSVPEVVKEGVNGFIVSNIDSMCEAVNKLDTLDSEVIRKDVVDNYSREVIADRYIRLFETAKKNI